MNNNDFSHRPLRFKPNRVRRTYCGGMLLDKWQGKPDCKDGYSPEEWMASTVEAYNKGMPEVANEGLSIECTSGMTLKKIIETDPEGILGKDHLKKFGNATGMLVKALDSMERLNIQVHPDKDLAKKLFNSDFGKIEAWYIHDVRNPADAAVYAGFKDGVTAAEWKNLFNKQDKAGMLDCLNRLPAKPGDMFFIGGGLPHAIGAGCLLMEIQEPTDITIRMERITSMGYKLVDDMIHNGIGFDRMFDCFHYENAENNPDIRKQGVVLHSDQNYQLTSLISYNDTYAFGLQKINITGKCRLGSIGRISLLVVLEGEGCVETSYGKLEAKQADSFLIPVGCGDAILSTDSNMQILNCMPPCL